MALKIASWMLAVGGCFVLAGLCFLPAAFGLHPDSALLSAGAMLFSTGMVMAASGMYVKARYWSEALPTITSADIKRGRRLCDLCGKQKTAVQCRVHELQLCPDCLEQHYDFRSCAYAPTTRQVSSKARARSQSSGA